MRLAVNRHSVFVSTGGRSHDRGAPTIVLLHGSGFTHHVWVLQGRALAHDGWNIIAPDLPGHGQSGGEALATIAEMGDWLFELLDTADCRRVVLAGHSMGGLIALEAAARRPERVAAVILVATAAAIPVNSALIDTAVRDPDQARKLMISWGYGSAAHLHDNTWPGASHIFAGLEIMRRNRPQVLATDLKACAAYRDGPERAKAIAQPCLAILAERDRMVPARRGLELAAMLTNCQTLVVPGSGHTLPTERPREVNAALRKFLATQRSKGTVGAK